MSGPAAELRRAVADAHGLPEGSEAFLRGETVEQVEESAVEFMRLLEERREQEPKPAPDFFAAAAAAKAERQRALVDVITGRGSQPRDERGRFAGSSGFDGGAREPLPPAPQSHDEWLVDALRDGRANAGGRF
jgi:hypothetical protein